MLGAKCIQNFTEKKVRNFFSADDAQDTIPKEHDLRAHLNLNLNHNNIWRVVCKECQGLLGRCSPTRWRKKVLCPPYNVYHGPKVPHLHAKYFFSLTTNLGVSMHQARSQSSCTTYLCAVITAIIRMTYTRYKNQIEYNNSSILDKTYRSLKWSSKNGIWNQLNHQRQNWISHSPNQLLLGWWVIRTLLHQPHCH